MDIKKIISIQRSEEGKEDEVDEGDANKCNQESPMCFCESDTVDMDTEKGVISTYSAR